MASREGLAHSNRIQYYPRPPTVSTARGSHKSAVKASLPASVPFFNFSQAEPPVELENLWLLPFLNHTSHSIPLSN